MIGKKAGISFLLKIISQKKFTLKNKDYCLLILFSLFKKLCHPDGVFKNLNVDVFYNNTSLSGLIQKGNVITFSTCKARPSGDDIWVGK